MTKVLANSNAVRDAFWHYASVVVCGSTGLFLTILIGAQYGPAVLGAFNIVFAIYIILSQVAAFGVHHSVLKHMAEFAHDAILRRLIFSCGLIVTVPLALAVSLGLLDPARTHCKRDGQSRCSTGLNLGLYLVVFLL